MELKLQLLTSVQRSNAPDSQLIILCYWCSASADFLPMSAYIDGRFVCTACAHTVRPGVPQYRCKCRACLALSDQVNLMEVIQTS